MTRAVFMGTPESAVPILESLSGVAEVPLVVTRPDRPRGRSGRLLPPPVKQRAVELGHAVAQPASAGELHDAVEEVGPDVVVVAAFGRLIRPELLVVPPHGFLNVHFSLLPRWRGASPVVRAILAGDPETGVSLMVMDEGLDTGPVLATAREPIAETDTAGSLTARLSHAGGALLADFLEPYLRGDLTAEPQDEAAATAAGKITTDEAHIDPLHHSATAVDRAVRAFDPKPGAWCETDGERLKIWGVTAAPDDVAAATGLATVIGGRVTLGVRDGSVELTEVQPAGKPRMSAAAWMNGRRGEPAHLS